MADPVDYEQVINDLLAEEGIPLRLTTTVDLEVADKAPLVEAIEERSAAWGEAWANVVRVLNTGPDEVERLRAKAVELEVGQNEPACAYCTHPHVDHMHDNPRRLCSQCMCTGYVAQLPAGSG